VEVVIKTLNPKLAEVSFAREAVANDGSITLFSTYTFWHKGSGRSELQANFDKRDSLKLEKAFEREVFCGF
jgi:hypothetical protein